jgi:hypothetical protein
LISPGDRIFGYWCGYRVLALTKPKNKNGVSALPVFQNEKMLDAVVLLQTAIGLRSTFVKRMLCQFG